MMTTNHNLHRIYSLLLRLFIGLSLASISHADNKKAHLPTIPVTIFEQTFISEVAATDVDRTQGLSDRPALPADQAMLFVYAQPNQLTFWMIKMLIPLDIVWLDSDKVVLGVTPNAETCIGSTPCTPDAPYSDQNRCQPGLARSQCPLLISPPATQYVLELAAGTAKQLHIVKGTPVKFELKAK